MAPDRLAKPSTLDTQWQQLMSLCASESRFKAEGSHPRLLKLLQSDIDLLAREMGISERLIVTRDFRAERDGDASAHRQGVGQVLPRLRRRSSGRPVHHNRGG
jgi:hypothetical protein